MANDSDAQHAVPPAAPEPRPDYTPYAPWPDATRPAASTPPRTAEAPSGWQGAPSQPVYPPMSPYGTPSQPVYPPHPGAQNGAMGSRGSGPFTGPVGYGGPPAGGFGGPAAGAYGPPPAADPYRGYPRPAVVVRGPGANGGAVAVEAILAFFGIYGIGWLMAGEVTTGVLLLLGGFVWAAIAITLAIVTLGIGMLCIAPIHIGLVALSAALLANHTKARP